MKKVEEVLAELINLDASGVAVYLTAEGDKWITEKLSEVDQNAVIELSEKMARSI